MKTLKNSLKFIFVLTLTVFASCKKDGNSTPVDDGDIDLKQYSIVGTYGATNVPYIVVFQENAKCLVSTGYLTANTNYTYKDGTLTITYSNNQQDVFKINGNTISSFSGADSFSNYKLQKNPETNALNGNTYSGSLRTAGSNLALIEKVKFGATQYGETSIGDPTLNKDYTIINNQAASSVTGANGVVSFFVLIDGKLEVARYTASANSSISVSQGTLTKQ